ncbi:MAG TPA: hypothetical protein VGJ02_07195, partial [Pyrinomonadaceae bacterium]
MSKRIVSLIVVGVSVFWTASLVMAQGPITCGTEVRSAALTQDFGRQAVISVLTPHAAEMLLYIDFNGETVRSGV